MFMKCIFNGVYYINEFGLKGIKLKVWKIIFLIMRCLW